MFAQDLLYQAAFNYQTLLDRQMILRLGHKGQLTDIRIVFERANFRHLSGLHKLTDIHSATHGRADHLYTQILNGNITENTIARSQYYHQIIDRPKIVGFLPQLFDDHSIAYRRLHVRRGLDPKFSRIPWQYLLEFELPDKQTGYLFLANDHADPAQFRGISTFRKGKDDYGRGHARYQVLQVIEQRHDQAFIRFKSPNYHD